ncbi:unnamed protein product [Cladocopium goreaui]|uniref:Uncharacterized protein n=1 Tax=Cladocopium goreaui TaxID=2562237 RepID=A0A9P1CL20_9DINO|nr:unnamed protein product [Cladocopium goreaui]
MGRAPTNAETIALRRLFFESSTLAVNEFKQRSERDETAEPTKMPVAERNARLEDQKKRLPGLHFSPETEPSHKLVDAVCQMATDQTLEWTPWEKLTSRSSEVTHSQKDLKFSLDSQGSVKVAAKTQSPDANVTGEMRVRCGRLSRAAKQSGFAVLPVDGPRNEHKVECPVLTLDLVRTEEQQCLLDTLRQLKPQAIHVTKSFGTWTFDTAAERGNCGEESLEKEGSKYGIYHTPEQFIERAISLTHPFDDKFAVEDLTRSNLFELLTKGKSHVAAQRLDFAKKLARWSKELVTEEARYLATLPLHAQKVLKGKKLLLFRKLLAESGCPDLGPSDIMSGLDLVGTASKSPFFDTKLVPATSTPQFLQMSAKWQRPKMDLRDLERP